MPIKPPPMKGSMKIGAFAGIGVYVHWSFLLLPAVLAYTELTGAGTLSDRIAAAAFRVTLVLATFACVVLHEFGHALTAKRFGVSTRDIVLLPIGGVARLERIPREPVQELWIALAGPAVNVGIVALIAGFFTAIGLVRGDVWSAWQADGMLGFFALLAAVNVALIVFNMIPAFPMDGGRVLRALLAMRLDHARATTIAARVGQVIAVGFVLAGLYTLNFLLILVAAMVYMGAGAEARQARIFGRLAGQTVRAAMITDFQMVPATMPLRRCGELLAAGAQVDFPVVEVGPDGAPGRPIGVLLRGDLERALAAGADMEAASTLATPVEPVLSPSDPVVEALERMQGAGAGVAMVVERGTLVGLVTIENIAELLGARTPRS